ncbi:helix-turn-helix protein [Microbacterium sp. SA39]|nr:helix-turn-helix protein [Microbacterium sp. SA39]
MSAQVLADAAGLTRSVIANIENGRRSDLSVTELFAISDALDVPPSALLFDVSRPFRKIQVGSRVITISAATRWLSRGLGAPKTSGGKRAAELLLWGRQVEEARTRIRHLRDEMQTYVSLVGSDLGLSRALGGAEAATDAAGVALVEAVARTSPSASASLRALLQQHDAEMRTHEIAVRSFVSAGGDAGVLEPAAIVPGD